MSASGNDGAAPARTGIWFVGARGSVATTAALGAAAATTGFAGRTGLVTELPEIAAARPAALEGVVIGGHDVSEEPLVERAMTLARGGVVPADLVRALGDELGEIDARIKTVSRNGTQPQRDLADDLEADIRAFKEAENLDRVVVVDVSSTEPPVATSVTRDHLPELERALDGGESPLPPSSLYAYAAYRAGCPVVAFTPSPGPNYGALAELAKENGLSWAGRDGKTGETLVKSALAPMFATRALNVRSWASINLLGGGDGKTLSDPTNATSKTGTKRMGLEAMLGYPVEGPIHIDYVEDLGDWKTAWDYITFEGFLGTKMTMQFTWEGCDSALAAPLVLDLARLVARADEVGEAGALGALGFFFKEPLGSYEHSLGAQWRALTEWCENLGSMS